MILQYRLSRTGIIYSLNLEHRTAYELAPRDFTDAARFVVRHLAHLDPVSVPLPPEAVPAVLAALAGGGESSPVPIRHWRRPYARLLP